MRSTGESASLWPMHLAFWVPITLATPMLVAAANPDDVRFPFPGLSLTLLALTGALAGATTLFSRSMGGRWHRRISVALLGLAMVVVVQGNVVHELFDYGELNGDPVDWRAYGWRFWLELWGFCLALPIVVATLLRLPRVPALLAWLPIASCAVLVVPEVLERSRSLRLAANEAIDDSVFEFSRQRNLIHLLPDGLQADVVKEVFEDAPALAAEFSGFTLFADQVGLYRSTAPTVPAIFNGRAFGIRDGHSVKKTIAAIRQHAYQNHLRSAGFRLDFVPTNKLFCTEGAASCVPRSINDLKARGYYSLGGASRWYSARLVADLTLFRHTPMFFKEKIYRDGRWLLSDVRADGSSPYPDPVIREWTRYMSVVDEPPRYKWYHYIGTHRPTQWDASCRPARGLKHTRENVKNQTYCLLSGIVEWLRKLRRLEIYDQTAIVISSDHGTHIEPYDLLGAEAGEAPHPRTIGSARPAFMIKELGRRGPMTVSGAPTSIIDVAPTALSLVGLSGEFDGVSALELAENASRTRFFRLYGKDVLWTGNPIPYQEYVVEGRANDLGAWKLASIFQPGAPEKP